MMSAVLGVVVVGLVSGATAAPASQEKAAYEVTIPGLGTVRGITANNSESIAFFGGGWRCVIRHDQIQSRNVLPPLREKDTVEGICTLCEQCGEIYKHCSGVLTVSLWVQRQTGRSCEL